MAYASPLLIHQHLDHIRDVPRSWNAWPRGRSLHSGAQDIAHSVEMLGQPYDPRSKEFDSEVAGRVDAAGRKMTSDVILVAGAYRMFWDGAREFLNENGS